MCGGTANGGGKLEIFIPCLEQLESLAMGAVSDRGQDRDIAQK